MQSLGTLQQRQPDRQGTIGFGHTESGLPRRAAICARGGKVFELYYVTLHHPRQTEGELTRRTSLDRGGQRNLCFGDRSARRAVGMAEEFTATLVREYVFFYDTGQRR